MLDSAYGTMADGEEHVGFGDEIPKKPAGLGKRQMTAKYDPKRLGALMQVRVGVLHRN